MLGRGIAPSLMAIVALTADVSVFLSRTKFRRYFLDKILILTVDRNLQSYLLKLRSFIYYVRKIFRKTNISYPLIRTRTCAYHGKGSIYFPENSTNVLNE